MNKDESKKIYGKNLKRLRQERGMSQEELAKALGFKNRSSINKIEIGRSSIPTNLIAKTAEVLGVSPLELFQEETGPQMKVSEEFVPELEILPSLWVDYEKLSDKSKEQVASYIQFLKKQEEGDNE